MDMTTEKTEKGKVIVGLSGGVDSSVAALILKRQGYEVIGVTMRQFETEDTTELEDAQKIAAFLRIPHIVIDMQKEFKEEVIDYFVSEYLAGRTPNPCIMCNPGVKFAALMKAMKSQDADYIATGHYAKIHRLENGRYTIALNHTGKDQTYALCRLSQEQLSHLLTPLNDLDKETVRNLAKEEGIPVACKKDSQDICFVEKGKYFDFIAHQAQLDGTRDNIMAGGRKEGNFIDEEGNILGQHKGISHYTIGQRKKLGLSLNRPVFVKEIRVLTNEIVISTDSDVFFDSLFCDNLVLMGTDRIEDGEVLTAKIRYAHEGSLCRVYNDNGLRVEFEKPVRAVTPGQAIVFYKDDCVYASAIIS